MKIKHLLAVLFVAFTAVITEAQVPQGINYQAIARDGSGNPITNTTIQVKMGILSDTINQIFVREELFSTVKQMPTGSLRL